MPHSSDIRRQFIDYFVEKCGHTFVPSSPVVPHGDPTLLFANAGMNQFKPYFLGTEQPDYPRAANTQKCIRAGGKHNDLEDVGKDTYHHTFFEMLGNWSFGDYFKAEAIDWAWDLLVNVWGIPEDRLHATVFGGDEKDNVPVDEEAEKLWQKYLPPERITRWGKKDNFWEMGDTGPCGPCSELHVDLTPDKSGGKLVNADDPRVIEVWNLVFIQYNRETSGKLVSLPAKHVDTGMGFERICAVLQGKTSNYDTDVFTPLFEAIADVTAARPYSSKLDDPIDMAYRVIADHIRCLTFALTDGAVPSNDGRGYVLRRILRRAVRHGWQTLDTHEPFLHRLVPAVVEHMGDAFPELKKDPQHVADIIKDEEQAFDRTLDRGIALFDEAYRRAIGRVTVPRNISPDTPALDAEEELDKAIDAFETGKQRVGVGKIAISGEDAFKLHDTYGFPLDLTQVMAEERGMTVDVEGFDRLMEEARDIARAGGGKADVSATLVEIVQKENLPKTEFVGYTQTQLDDAKVIATYRVGETGYEAADEGELLAVVTDRTPFYAEAGGQVGDVGTIGDFEVSDTVKVGDVYFHLGRGRAPKGTAAMRVAAARRDTIAANHTSTHILNRALRLHVNKEADQRGSLVDDEKLRFDFSHNSSLTAEQLEQVEQMVNHDIASDLPVYYDYAPQEQARNIKGLRAVFGEKYPPMVRIVSIGVEPKQLLAEPDNDAWANYSIEFCGGTHLAKTGDAEGFTIISEEAVAKGIRRVTALTGSRAHQAEAHGQMLLSRVDALKQADDQHIASGIAELTIAMGEKPVPALMRAKLQAGIADLQKRAKAFDKQQSRAQSGQVVEQARRIAEQADGDLIVAAIDGADGNTLRDAMDVIRQKCPDAALLLGAAADGKCAFIAAVPKPYIEKGLKAGDWVREVAKVAGGGGGGRPDMAQAGGKDPSKLNDALNTARDFAASKM
jgi:alanyl-tRNA synthetase